MPGRLQDPLSLSPLEVSHQRHESKYEPVTPYCRDGPYGQCKYQVHRKFYLDPEGQTGGENKAEDES